MSKTEGKIIDIKCSCWEELFKYQKKKRGRLIRAYIKNIKEDKYNLLVGKDFQDGDSIYCPICKKRIGSIFVIKWSLALKVNQWAIQYIKT